MLYRTFSDFDVRCHISEILVALFCHSQGTAFVTTENQRFISP